MIAIVVCFLAFAITATSTVHAALPKRVMVWMCLEFCQESSETISKNLAEIQQHSDVLTAVSFEKYTLGPNSTLVDNDLTTVSFQLNAFGLETWPLLSSYPHPPEFIDWMRSVFDNPEPFIESCISEANKFKYVGYNLDWEPTDNVTDEDGIRYAEFIETFSQALHQHHLLLSVDVATWSPIWNYTAIAATSVDMIISMGTYTSTDSSFSKQLDLLLSSFGSERSGVGLETVNASTSERISLDEVVWRFQQISLSGAREVDIWCMPVPPLWWPLLRSFKNNQVINSGN